MMWAFCFVCASTSLVLQYGDFVPHEWLTTKGLFKINCPQLKVSDSYKLYLAQNGSEYEPVHHSLSKTWVQLLWHQQEPLLVHRGGKWTIFNRVSRIWDRGRERVRAQNSIWHTGANQKPRFGTHATSLTSNRSPVLDFWFNDLDDIWK